MVDTNALGAFVLSTCRFESCHLYTLNEKHMSNRLKQVTEELLKRRATTMDCNQQYITINDAIELVNMAFIQGINFHAEQDVRQRGMDVHGSCASGSVQAVRNDA